MKKLIAPLVIVLALVVGGYTWYQKAYGGENYYVKITTDGKATEKRSDNGEKFTQYEYELEGYNKAGDKKTIPFTGSKNLKHDAILKITVNAKKGVTSWEEVSSKEVPSKALDAIDDK